MANIGSSMERVRKKKRVTPQQDAEQHIQLKIDKAGLEERFINLHKGRGVFATEAFRIGDFVLEYRGKLLKQDVPLSLRHYDDTEAVFLFDFQWKGKNYCLDASVEDKSLGRLVNDDNRKPNCKMKTIDIVGMPHLCLFAIKDITPGEEVTYNYGDADWPWRKQKSSPEVWKQTVDESDRPQVGATLLHRLLNPSGMRRYW
ncbi:N-lysine methyltransferase KMT5A-A-like isoform X2 [Centropristis striata]|uniref:N-lysine methyltransferase KMT5A-A-like isoform X2 n=1 Tax=Centropristis striata TaxID=184440 RepID=UPI0027E05759|nr:N-lysine methyltransferase KMT5A-A-like isoform X2 [Centropristis striata]XP_059186444.1 N-lysine methyltransferase KMT5A-A-like isoform X2 [Centropristis striata]XP_059192336.1 N-lysine methyltransferase KMT5A-A-like isoform X2 [Centropristis striata]XP_059211726.1 N-lysine methyltransferase KMT5A-A-like isoform X2 [Centropristis striata]